MNNSVGRYKTSKCFLENFEEFFAKHGEVFVFRVSLAHNQTDVFLRSSRKEIAFCQGITSTGDSTAGITTGSPREPAQEMANIFRTDSLTSGSVLAAGSVMALPTIIGLRFRIMNHSIIQVFNA